MPQLSRLSVLQPVLAGMLLLPGFSVAQTATQADSIAIVQASTAFSRAYERGDVNALIGLYTDDAVIFPDQSEALSGREVLLRYWTLRPGNRVTHHQLTSHSLTIHDGFAHDWGTYEVSGEQDGNAWGPVLGKYVVVWQKGAEGAWRMRLDIWNRRPQPRP
jgi:ketosteroid isomerase-like protein